MNNGAEVCELSCNTERDRKLINSALYLSFSRRIGDKEEKEEEEEEEEREERDQRGLQKRSVLSNDVSRTIALRERLPRGSKIGLYAYI